MLFKRLYSWLKHKLLPTSTRSLDRLWVERDSNHRRTSNDLGLTYRQAKWSIYSRDNTNLEYKSSYNTFGWQLLKFLLFLLFCYVAYTYYYLEITSWCAYHWLWFTYELETYTRALIASSMWHFLRSANTLSQSYASPDLYSTQEMKEYSIKVRKEIPGTVLEIHFWRNTDQRINASNPFFHNMRKVYVKRVKGEPNIWFNKLYRALVYFGVIEETRTYEEKTTKKPVKEEESKEEKKPSGKQSLLVDWDTSHLKQFLGIFYHPLNEVVYWTLSNTQAELENNRMRLKSNSGVFYLSPFSYSELNHFSFLTPELSHIRNSVDHQLKVIQWNRWLYKYNVLHRSILQSERMVTISKRFISNGFYDSRLPTRNIWIASSLKFSRVNSKVFSPLTHLVYGKLATDHPSANNSFKGFCLPANFSSLSSFSFYEESYQWFIHRFYALNTLNTQTIKLTRRLPSSYNTRIRHEFRSKNGSQFSSNTECGEKSWRYYMFNKPTRCSVHLMFTDYIILPKAILETSKNMSANYSIFNILVFPVKSIRKP